ncbi:MAG: UDP-3-O-(3-hydroxymyristoyl)glucosamine N-acyltransferase [Prevotellaceae bacterium]|nr:UDP-3-O-(3-hydroxymyristoyl)glucosamine N-acyltransferase [Candidatus Colivivens equi]
MDFQAQQIAQLIGGIVDGNPEEIVNTFAKIEEGKPGAISFLANAHYEHYIYETKSSVVLVNKTFQPSQPLTATLIRVDNPYESVAKLLQIYDSMKPKRIGVDPLAFISSSAKIGKDVYIAPFVVVGDNAEVGDGVQLYPHVSVGEHVKIGNGTILYSNAVVYHHCVIGSGCILHSGCVIGADGFGFAPTPEGYEKIPQIGNVILEDNVEVGANACIDRSTMGSTLVHKGVKLDNMVQIAHNVEVGANTVMSAQAGVAGSAKIGEWCMLGGQVGVAGHIKIGDRTNAGAQSGLPGGRLLEKGNVTVMGYPALEHKNFARSAAAYKNLPELVKQVNDLQKKVEELSAKL